MPKIINKDGLINRLHIKKTRQQSKDWRACLGAGRLTLLV